MIRILVLGYSSGVTKVLMRICISFQVLWTVILSVPARPQIHPMLEVLGEQMLIVGLESTLGSVYPMGLYYSVYLATGSYCCRSKRRVFPELKPPSTAPACCCCREKSQASSVKQDTTTI